MKIFKYSKIITILLIIFNIIIGIGLPVLYIDAVIFGTDVPSRICFDDIIYALGIACPILIIVWVIFKIDKFLRKSTH